MGFRLTYVYTLLQLSDNSHILCDIRFPGVPLKNKKFGNLFSRVPAIRRCKVQIFVLFSPAGVRVPPFVLPNFV